MHRINDYWYRNGVQMDIAGICEWIETGCECAVSVEDMLDNLYAQCRVGFESPHSSHVDEFTLHTIYSTDELNQWLMSSVSPAAPRYMNLVRTDKVVLPKPDPLSDPFHARTVSVSGENNEKEYFAGFMKPRKPLFMKELSSAKKLSEDKANEVAYLLFCENYSNVKIHKEEELISDIEETIE